jgi:ABC-type uncharacterized transport system substrate-binding protein
MLSEQISISERNPCAERPFTLAVLLLASVHLAEAQQAKKLPRVGVLDPGSPQATTLLGPLREGLRERGYVEGKNIVIEYRYAEGKLNRLPDLAKDLVRSKVDIMVPQSPTAVRAAHTARKHSIVMAGVAIRLNRIYSKFGTAWRNLTALKHVCGVSWKETRNFQGGNSTNLRLVVFAVQPVQQYNDN